MTFSISVCIHSRDSNLYILLDRPYFHHISETDILYLQLTESNAIDDALKEGESRLAIGTLAFKIHNMLVDLFLSLIMSIGTGFYPTRS